MSALGAAAGQHPLLSLVALISIIALVAIIYGIVSTARDDRGERLYKRRRP